MQRVAKRRETRVEQRIALFFEDLGDDVCSVDIGSFLISDDKSAFTLSLDVYLESFPKPSDVRAQLLEVYTNFWSVDKNSTRGESAHDGDVAAFAALRLDDKDTVARRRSTLLDCVARGNECIERRV